MWFKVLLHFGEELKISSRNKSVTQRGFIGLRTVYHHSRPCCVIYFLVIHGLGTPVSLQCISHPAHVLLEQGTTSMSLDFQSVEQGHGWLPSSEKGYWEYRKTTDGLGSPRDPTNPRWLKPSLLASVMVSRST